MAVKKIKKPKSRLSLSRVSFSSMHLLAFVVVFGAAGGLFLAISHAQTPDTVTAFAENPARGLHWGGLQRGTGPCNQAFQILANGRHQGCTHGPDPAPAGLNAQQSVEPLSTGVATAPDASSSGIICDGDGVTGYRVQMIYAHASDQPDRYSQYAGSFQQYAANMNSIMVESGNQTGSPRYIRFVTDASCNVSVPDVTLSTTGDDSFGNTISELESKGYNRADRKYIVWTDANLYCGIAQLFVDFQPGQANINNSGPAFGRIDNGCWGGRAEAHELMHTLGAVDNDAPDGSGNWHCNDGYDVMCYPDGGYKSAYTTTACPNVADNSHYDCNKNDYFNTSTTIPANSFLATHWNTANNRFLISSASATPPPPLPVPAVTLTASPASITSGSQSILSWSSTNATSCTASGAWSGAKPLAGSQYTGALYSNSTFSLTCTGAGGSATANTTVSVAAATLAPSLNISASPASVSPGSQSIIAWSSANATSCTASGAWSGAKAVSGSQYTGALYVNSTFSLTCSGAGGSVTKSAVVYTASSGVPRIVYFAASPSIVKSGAKTYLYWNSGNTTSCTASGGWSGTKAPVGNTYSAAIYRTTTFGLNCSGPGGSAFKSITVTVSASSLLAKLDTTAPTVKVTSPADGDVLRPSVFGLGGASKIISASATDNSRVAGMDIYLDGKKVASTLRSDINYRWNFKQASKGEHSIKIVATDAVNNLGSTTIFIVK